MSTEEGAVPLEGWIVLELMGRQRRIGYATDVVAFGVHLCRLETPGVGEMPAEVHYASGQSIYGITPTTQEAVLAELEQAWQRKLAYRLQQDQWAVGQRAGLLPGGTQAWEEGHVWGPEEDASPEDEDAAEEEGDLDTAPAMTDADPPAWPPPLTPADTKWVLSGSVSTTTGPPGGEPGDGR